MHIIFFFLPSEGFMEFPLTPLERVDNAPLTKDPLFDTRLAGMF